MRFTKMHGLGNDFIVIEAMEKEYFPTPNDARRLCNRHTGIGADGLMLALPSQKADLRMRLLNSDGSTAEMCGNGIRCFAKFAYERLHLAISEVFLVISFIQQQFPNHG